MPGLPNSLENKLKHCGTLPSIPVVALQVLALCQDEDIGIQKVARVLERDPALSAKVLKVANSAWYGVRSQITTLDRSMSLLGINATLSLALSFSLVRSLGSNPKGRSYHKAYWKRSVIASVAARIIGIRSGSARSDELFVAGLLQDIGILVLNETIPDQYGPMIAKSEGDHRRLIRIELETFGADHAAVGEWLLCRWNLPEKLRMVVGRSHAPDVSAGSETDLLTRGVALASDIADIWVNPQTDVATATARDTFVRSMDGTGDQFEQLLAEIAEALPEATCNLDVDIGGELMVNRILDQAREALVVLNLKAQQKTYEFHQRSQTDPLTSLSNRACLDEILPQYFTAAQRQGEPLSIIFLDLDYFKKINDTYGHQAGDAVLKAVARVLMREIRKPDIVGRFGGEEFLCLLPNTPEPGAAIVGERLRTAIAKHRYEVGENLEIRVTISVGCATHSTARTFASIRELINAADQCLYAAKNAGRNTMVTLDKLLEGLHQPSRSEKSPERQPSIAV